MTVLGGLNGHVNQDSGAHAASAISVADAGNNLNAVNVETSLAEILDAHEGDHFRGNEANAGQHRTIRQPALNGSMALVLDSNASGSASPSSITLSSPGQSSGFTGNPSTFTVNRDGFGYFSYQSIPATGTGIVVELAAPARPTEESPIQGETR